MSEGTLTADQLRFINLVARRRVLGEPDAVAPPPMSLDEISDPRPPRRAAALAAAVVRPGTLDGAALPTALLAVICQLDRDGFRLVAPQGAAAGMVRGLAAGEVSLGAFAAWLEDRAVPE